MYVSCALLLAPVDLRHKKADRIAEQVVGVWRRELYREHGAPVDGRQHVTVEVPGSFRPAHLVGTAEKNYVPPTMPNPAAERRRQEYEKALASDLLIGPKDQSQVLETPRLVSAGGEPVEGQDNSVSQSNGPIVADAHPASPYTITTGTVIYGTLETGINSDIPGDLLGRVAQDVKDSVTERYVLIPQGSKLIGSYSNQLIPSQERLMVRWRKIVFPNGGELNLPDLTGSDAAGYAGFQDQVNHHYAKVWAPALLMSAISAGMMMSDYPTTTSGGYGTGAYSMSPAKWPRWAPGNSSASRLWAIWLTFKSHPPSRSGPAITSACWSLATWCFQGLMRMPRTRWRARDEATLLDTPHRNRRHRLHHTHMHKSDRLSAASGARLLPEPNAERARRCISPGRGRRSTRCLGMVEATCRSCGFHPPSLRSGENPADQARCRDFRRHSAGRNAWRPHRRNALAR